MISSCILEENSHCARSSLFCTYDQLYNQATSTSFQRPSWPETRQHLFNIYTVVLLIKKTFFNEDMSDE